MMLFLCSSFETSSLHRSNSFVTIEIRRYYYEDNLNLLETLQRPHNERSKCFIDAENGRRKLSFVSAAMTIKLVSSRMSYISNNSGLVLPVKSD